MSKPHSERPLTLPMMRALQAVRNVPGQPINAYVGGKRSIEALVRRRMVQIGKDSIVTLTEAGAQIHLHIFKRTLHLDGCHYFSDAGTCECGATYKSYIERNLKEDPYSMIWMDPGTVGDDDADVCQRCQELIAGARPVQREEVFERRGSRAA